MASWLRRARNWRGETKTQELERRVTALEASLPAAHERINELDGRLGEHTNQRWADDHGHPVKHDGTRL